MAAKCLEGVCGYERSNRWRNLLTNDGACPQGPRERSDDGPSAERRGQNPEGHPMAGRQRKPKEDARPVNQISDRTLAVELQALLLDIEMHYDDSKRLGLSMVRMNRIPRVQAELLIKLIRRELDQSWQIS